MSSVLINNINFIDCRAVWKYVEYR